MPNVTILPNQKMISAESGSSLLDALLASGEKVNHNCDRNGNCGTCHIFVTKGRKSLSKMTRLENDKLDAVVGVGSNSRLACQALLGGEDITVELVGL